jgi:hypothetical protein
MLLQQFGFSHSRSSALRMPNNLPVRQSTFVEVMRADRGTTRWTIYFAGAFLCLWLWNAALKRRENNMIGHDINRRWASTVVRILIMSGLGRGVWKNRWQRDTPTLCHPDVHTPNLEGKKWVMSTCRVQKTCGRVQSVWEPPETGHPWAYPSSTSMTTQVQSSILTYKFKYKLKLKYVSHSQQPSRHPSSLLSHPSPSHYFNIASLNNRRLLYKFVFIHVIHGAWIGVALPERERARGLCVSLDFLRYLHRLWWLLRNQGTRSDLQKLSCVFAELGFQYFSNLSICQVLISEWIASLMCCTALYNLHFYLIKNNLFFFYPTQ